MKIRIIAAIAVLVSAGVHLRLWSTGVKHEHVVGPAFMVNAVAGIVIAILLLAWQSWEPPLLAVGFGVSTLSAFFISATAGLFGVHEHWTGSYVWTAFIAEVVAIIAGLAAFRSEDWMSRMRRPQGNGVGRTARV